MLTEKPPAAPTVAQRAEQEISVNEFVNSAGVEKERYAGNLALWLILTLVATLLVHYTAILVLISLAKPTEALDQIFHAWLPVLSGFVGSAVTYYFTRDRGRS